ncbi:type II toxin-antitoxin system Phd/YefM family antitoxin [Streptomyces sp. NPDC085946]|uniref:type II toxin-antitoxin system Phd/YefM family antitoxin n=1 Tax=Streptomyces sp. NPDC085946 TaxID=3365744 RepID=UPI0037D5BA3C
MEKSYGIEAARAQLGDIVDHARTTGQTIALTRHGRTVAVIGPAEAVKPSGGVEVTLYYPHDQSTCVLPALPRTGDSFLQEVELGPESSTETRWSVTEVQWHMSSDGTTYIGVSLDPADDHTVQIMGRQRQERIAAARAAEK